MSDLILPGNTIPAHVLTGDTFSAGINYGAAGSMPNNGGVILTPSTAQQAIAAGYHDGTGHVNGDANLIAANINVGTTIFGVVGASPRKQKASGSGTTASNNATVTGLAFQPSLIVLEFTHTGTTYRISYFANTTAPATVQTLGVGWTGSTVLTWGASPWTVNSTSFVAALGTSNGETFTWTAYE